ncbi:MAG: hypothetical protein HGB22_08360 [Chlorobiaceae bacterium]|nr:hypothetical protein [Chlorobiaceae bacterium]
MIRNRLIRNIVMLSVMFFTGYAASWEPSTARAAETAAAPATVTAPTETETTYALQHMIIPGILFSENGSRFFNDLFTGNNAPFLEIVEGPLGKAYASGMKIVPEHFQEFDIVIISFPTPYPEPLCIHSALVKKGDTFRYITLESGNDTTKNGTKTFLCEWSAEHVHKNFGPRKYVTAAEFRAELISLLKQ